MKPFSLGGIGAAINLFNITSGQLIKNAPVKGQCAKDYLYGDDLVVEKALQKLEGAYGVILKKIQSGDDQLSSSDLSFLRNFSYLQYSRTDMAIRRNRLAMEKLENAIFEGNEHQRPISDLSDRTLMREAMIQFQETVKYISDLKVCLVRNRASSPFITSDDPAISTNRFYAQRVGSRFGGVGLGNAGAMIFMPLTPEYLVVSYDGGVYTVPGKIGCVIETHRLLDVAAVNELQHLKAAENLYFHDWRNADKIKTAFEAVQPRRPETWCEVNVAVLDRTEGDWKRYRVADTMEERLAAKESIVHLSSKYPKPNKWFSKIRIRSRPRFIDTESGAGLERPSNPIRSHESPDDLQFR